jgi:hypothetical protein
MVTIMCQTLLTEAAKREAPLPRPKSTALNGFSFAGQHTADADREREASTEENQPGMLELGSYT